MTTTFIYDASDRTMRKRIQRYAAVQVIIAYCLVLAITTVLTMSLPFVAEVHGSIPWFPLFGMVTVFTLIIGCIVIGAAGARSICTKLQEDRITIHINGTHIHTIEYTAIERVYTERLSKTRLWQRVGGVCIVCIKPQKHERLQIALTRSIDEADELVAYIQTKIPRR